MAVSPEQLAEIEKKGGKVRMRPRSPAPEPVPLQPAPFPAPEPQPTTDPQIVAQLTTQVANLTAAVQVLANRVAEIEGREGAIVNIEYKDIQGSPFPRMSAVKVEYT